MSVWIAFLRAVNVGGTNLLPMRDLVALCQKLGFLQARTCLQSGNVIINSERSADQVKGLLEGALSARLGKPVDVLVRSAAELGAILKANPFPEADPAKVAVVLLSAKPSATWLKRLSNRDGEEVRLGKRELYIHYPIGMGRSRLRLPPLGGPCTARNLNTISKLVGMTAGDVRTEDNRAK